MAAKNSGTITSTAKAGINEASPANSRNPSIMATAARANTLNKSMTRLDVNAIRSVLTVALRSRSLEEKIRRA